LVESVAPSYPLLAWAMLAFIALTAAVSITLYRRRQPDLSDVRGSAVLGPGIRGWYFDNLRPFEDWCVRHRITPTTLTYAQLAGSVVVMLCYASGYLFVAGWLLLTVGSLDIIDGRVARRTGGASARGAFLDSVVDRYADTFAFTGLAIYFRSSWVIWVVLLTLLGSTMVSYTRARAESLGIECRVGLFQRPERTVVLGFGTLFAVLLEHIAGPLLWDQPFTLLVITLLVMMAFTNFSALQRVVHVQRQLGSSSLG